MRYALNDLYPYIQGEGVMAGTPMMLVRLQGCGVGCPWCDTKETWPLDLAVAIKGEDFEDGQSALTAVLGTNGRWGWFTGRVIATAAWRARGKSPIGWALLTGGEPADQDLQHLVFDLQSRGFKVAIETSGTAMGYSGSGADWLTVSPKVGMPGGRPVLGQAIADADEVKMVVCTEDDVETLARLVNKYRPRPGAVVSVQPVSMSPKASRICTEAAMKHGWRVSVQTHKIMGVR